MKLRALPFHIGATVQPFNPEGLPASFPFEVVFDDRLGSLRQPVTSELEEMLNRAYQVGHRMGTPLADDSFGQPYVVDFLSFIAQAGLRPGAALEIGAGVGYLSRCLLDLGWQMTSVEPGKGYEPWQRRYGIEVVREFFPSPRTQGPFDMICSYGVLEHIADPLAFLQDVKRHLRPGGWVFLAVPDCTAEIHEGDPAILFHEHWSYFDAGSLARLLAAAGLRARVVRSGYGRCLYVMARADAAPAGPCEPGLPLDTVESYPERCARRTVRLREQLAVIAEAGSLGVYCAARGLAVLDPEWKMRFFDDDPAQQGKYLPPFSSVIEGRSELLARPVDAVAILSTTFGARIREGLREAGYRGRVVTLDELVG
jgi:SAM-dependent methyltransferase